jgi:hypothetical protein
MSSMVGAAESGRDWNSLPLGDALRAAIWLPTLLLGSGLSLLLTCRRIAGALNQAPSGAALVLAAISLAIVAALLRRATPRPVGPEMGSACPSVVAILILTAVTLPGTPSLGIATAWFVLVGSEVAGWLLPRLARSPPAESPDPSQELELAEGLVQKVTRVREGEQESIHALIRAEAAAGDRMAVVHLAFCPPLAARPNLAAHALDVGDAEVKITLAETFGARIEVRLPRVHAAERTLLVEVLGSATCSQDS